MLHNKFIFESNKLNNMNIAIVTDFLNIFYTNKLYVIKY